MATAVKTQDAYIGEKRKQIREGFGVYTYENKFFRYQGEWLNGKKQGHGKLLMADGSYYEGEFDKGEINGHGYRFFASSRNVYSGEFHLGEINGQGVMRYADGSTYEGEWENNKRHGYGIYHSADGSAYQGNFYKHMRHGHGTWTNRNGEEYDGDWVLDNRQGHGQWTSLNGDVYNGQWRNNLYNGQGKITQISGVSYDGMWVNGLPENMATKLVITAVNGAINLAPGEPFTISIECQTADGEVMEDCGREIVLIAGMKYVEPSNASSKLSSVAVSGKSSVLGTMTSTSTAVVSASSTTSQKKSTVTTSKLDNELSRDTAISATSGDVTTQSTVGAGVDETEQQRLQLINTPFGYSVIPRALCVLALNDEVTSVGEGSSHGELESKQSRISSNTEQSSMVGESTASKTESEVKQRVSDILSRSQQSKSVASLPVANLSSNLDMSTQDSNKLSANSDEATETTLGISAVVFLPLTSQRTNEGRVVFERLVLPAMSQSETSVSGLSSLTTVSERSSTDLFAKPGEYVILAQDVTEPAFLDIVLESAAVEVNLISRESSAKLKPSKSDKSRSRTSVPTKDTIK